MENDRSTSADSNHHRIDQFRDDIAELDLKTPADGRERSMLVVGGVVMAVGFLLILGGYIGASGTAIVAEQLPYVISGGFLGVAVVLVGAAIFVRYSLSRYLRFWLVREIYEQRTQTDRVVESLAGLESVLRADRPRSSVE